MNSNHKLFHCNGNILLLFYVYICKQEVSWSILINHVYNSVILQNIFISEVQEYTFIFVLVIKFYSKKALHKMQSMLLNSTNILIYWELISDQYWDIYCIPDNSDIVITYLGLLDLSN